MILWGSYELCKTLCLSDTKLAEYYTEVVNDECQIKNVRSSIVGI